MYTPDTFFLIVLATIAITRVWLFRRPLASPKLFGFKLHHYMYGIAILIAGYFMKSILIYSIGAGLIVDELPFVLYLPKGFSWREYESKAMFTGVLILLVVIYFLRNHLAPGFSSLI